MRRPSALLTALLTSSAIALSAGPASATLTQWPTCPAPPGGDYALCTQGAFPQSVIPGPDGAVWFTTARGNLGRATLAGGITQADLPAGVTTPQPGLLGGLTVGPDGALWFPEYASSGLWHGTATAPPVFGYAAGGATATGPQDVALGPDGALWVAQAKVDAVGREVPGGAFTQIALPPKAAGTFVSSFAIVAGPDGRMWIGRGRAIDAVSTAGVVTAYPLPAMDADDLTVGPDGAIWFTDYSTDRVGRITTSGAITTFDLPSATAPASITTGPDGALWIGLGKGGGIMRMTTAGAWTVTPLLFSSQISSITTGPDGAIWFGDLADSRIGRLDVAPAGAAPAVSAVSPAFGAAGAAVTVSGSGLRGATAVTVGGVAATFTAGSDSALRITIPAGAGGQPVRVTTSHGTSPATDAARFTYATAGTSPSAAPPATTPAPTVTIGSATLSSSGVLTVSVRSTKAASYALSAALPASGTKAHIAARAKLKLATAGKATGRLQHTGASKLRVTLSHAALKTVRAAGHSGARVEVGVELRLGAGQASVGQRTLRLRVHG